MPRYKTLESESLAIAVLQHSKREWAGDIAVRGLRIEQGHVRPSPISQQMLSNGEYLGKEKLTHSGEEGRRRREKESSGGSWAG